MLCQRSVNGIGAVLTRPPVRRLHALIKVMLLMQMTGAVRALHLANGAIPMGAGTAALTRDVHRTAPSGHASDASYFYCPYPGYDDWVIPGGRKVPGQNQTLINELNENNQIQHINLYSVSNRGPVTYDILHTFWAKLTINTYSVKTFAINENRPPIVKAALKIFWTMDKTNIADNVRIIAIRERQDNEMFPVLVDVGNTLSKADRWRVLQNTLQEAFDYWSTILYGHVVFEYVEYTAELNNAAHFNRVIIASMKDMVHVDEHTNVVEGFTSKSTLAHASINFIHFNRQSSESYIAPHLQSERVYIAQQNKNGSNNTTTIGLHEMSTVVLARMYKMKNYKHLYNKLHKSTLRKVIYRNNTNPWCFLCVAIHEIGHVLGIGHTSDRQSVMYSYYRSDEVIYREDDKRAFRTLYAGLISRAETIDMNNRFAQCHQIPYFPSRNHGYFPRLTM